MDIFSFFSMIGGLALFLYGMSTMGDALSKMAGGKLEHILEKMISNPIKAVLLGAGVTAVIQSSSATTVMVVGFVNSQIMKLSQAVGVIMGANIGTTITSWMLSLTGIEGDNILIKLLKPSSFSPILAMIGIILIMFIKNEKKRDIGTILMGFAVLMFGMETMSGAVKPLAEVPEFTSLFVAFEHPVLGMLVGTLLTAIIQSSSASVGILQAMCITGSVSFGAAIPIIMGQNIGTCITTIISGVGANKNAKRASLIHLYFNLIGTAAFMIIFYSINAFVHFEFLGETAGVVDIAIIHSLFNIVSTLVLMPASGILEKLAFITIPKTDEEDMQVEPKLLDERFLERPAFAVAQCKHAVCEMAQVVEQAVGLCGHIQSGYDKETVQKIIDIEDEVDIMEDELSTYLTKVSAKALSEKDSKEVGKYIKCIVDFERISDYAKGIAYAFKRLDKKGEKFSKSATKEAEAIFAATMEVVEYTVRCFVHDDKEMAFRINPLADIISEMKREISRNHKKRLAKGKCSVETGMALTDMINSLERIAKHCSNIAEESIASETDSYAFHQYARIMKEGNEEYKQMIEEYKERYSVWQ